jgi:drug/metabolite transporter (DMT)-like permease
MIPKRKLAFVNIAIACLLWGIAGVVIKLTLAGIEPFPFLTYRFAISAIVGVILVLTTKHHLPSKPSLWIPIIVYGLLSTTIALGFLFLGLDKTTVLNLSLITLMVPLFVEFAGVIFLNEKISKRGKTGTIIAFLGTLFTVIEPILKSNGGIGELKGNIFIMLYILADTSSILILKKILKKQYSESGLVHISFIIGFFSMLPLTLFFYTPQTLIKAIGSLTLPYHLGVIYMAIFSGTIAYTLRNRGQKVLSVGETGLFGYLVPIFTAVLALVILGETLTPLYIIGGVIVVVGVIIAEIHR